MKNPLSETDEVVSQGQEVFLGSCAQCHGADGRGDTNIGRNMYPPAMDLSSPHVQHWSDAELFWIIQNGVRLTGMPSWKSSISDNDTWKLARFIHHLPRLDAASASPAVPSQAQAAISTQACPLAELRSVRSRTVPRRSSAARGLSSGPLQVGPYCAQWSCLRARLHRGIVHKTQETPPGPGSRPRSSQAADSSSFLPAAES